ncbi:MAG: hypothetical protein OEL87_03545 [Nanoarchaeota archaeon]|nr:hypothetical protein [Nanoarchaeota archaeon]
MRPRRHHAPSIYGDREWKKKVFFAIVIAIFLLVLFFAFWPGTDEVRKEAKACFNNTDKVAVSICVSILAENSKDESLCELLAPYRGSGLQGMCYTSVAGARRDADICFLIVDNGLGDIDGCVSSVAAREADSSICEKIRSQEKKDSCIERVVRILG